MPTLKDLENTDDLYNPSKQAANSLYNREGEAGKNTGANTSTGQSESSGSMSNIAATKNAEESRQGYWTGGNKQAETSQGKQKLTLKGRIKKSAPAGGIIGFIIGIPTIIAIFLSPALVLQQFAASISDAFNDQLAAMDMRSVALLKKKYNSTLTSGCSTVSIRCKYKTIRTGSGLAKRLNNAGVTIEGNKSLVPGRIKPTHFVFEGKRIPAKQLLNEAKNNASLRKALRKGYDPLYAGFSDRKSADIRTRLGLKKSSEVKPSVDQDKMNEDLKATAAGDNDLPADGSKITDSGEKDKDGNPIYKDADGNTYTKAEANRINGLIDESIGRDKLADKVGKTATKATLKGALTATAFGAGAIDSACTAWTMIRVAGYAAKYYQQRQLIRYGYEFVKFAHKQKAGEATAEETIYFANKLTSTNSEGKGALDSHGYRFAAYGDSFSPGSFTAETENLKKNEVSDEDINKILVQNETSKYINGQLVSTSLMAKIAGAVTNSNSATVSKADDVCKFTKSWKGQALVFGLAAAGAIVAFFTGGASVSVGAIAQGAVSVAISVTFALLQPKLIEMAKGEVIQGDENGNETGNAVVSGMGGYNAQTAQGRGLGVATESTYETYNQLSSQIAAKYAKEDRENRSPFDPTSKNTFIGSILANITPFVAKMSSVSSAGPSMASFVVSNIASLGLTANAAEGRQWDQCDDPEYKDRNLAADPFCNLRYAIPVSDLNIDPDVVLDYMINNNHVTEDNAEPLGDYKDYVAKCFDRQSSIGDKFTSYEDGESEGGGDAGDQCVVGKGGENEERNRMFRLFYIDTTISDGLDEDFGTKSIGEGVGDGTGITLNIASFNVRGASHDGEGGTTSYVTRMKRTVETITNEGFDIIGFQEFETSQRKEFNKSSIGGTYKLSSNEAKQDNGNAIGWDNSKYTLVSQGTQPNLKYTVGNTLKAPWVKLKENTSGQEFYVLNTHDPANVHDNPVTKNAARRTENAKQHVSFMKEKAKEGIPVFSTGDFNSSFKKRGGDVNVTNTNIKTTLPYCIMTSDGTIFNAFDTYKKRQIKCPNNDINWNKEDPGKGCSTQIDHLYYTSTTLPVNIAEFGCVKKGDSKKTVANGNGSDHDTVKFTVTVGDGSDGSVNGGDLAWPLNKALYKANKADWLNAHGSTGTAWGGDNMGTSGKGAYTAADIGAPVGTPVFAMLGGVVTSTSLCGVNDGIAIKSKIGGKTVGIAYMHGKDKKFSKGDTVKAGDRIMSVGLIGCNVNGAHLHLGMAYEGKYICPQDLFLALDKNASVDWASLPGKAATTCGR